VFTKLLFHYYIPRLSLDWNINGLDAIERYHTVGTKSIRELRRISYSRLGLQKGGYLSGRGKGRWLYTLHGRSSKWKMYWRGYFREVSFVEVSFVEVSVLLARNWRVGKVMQEFVPSLWRCIQVTYSNRDVLKEDICRPM